MKKTILLLFFLALSVVTLDAQTAFKGFEGAAIDNWDFTSNIPFYAENSDTDLWTEYSQANGRIAGAFAGGSYLAARDLDNPTTEAFTGQASPEHILTFDPFGFLLTKS